MVAKRKSKNRNWIIIGVIAVVILAVVIARFMNPPSIPYDSSQAKVGDIITYYSFSGNVETINRQSVLAGKVLQISDIKVEEGQVVEEDYELIRTTAGEKIKAGIDGEVVNINVQDNEQVMSGTQLLEIVDYDHLKVTVKVDEYDLPAIEKGKEATVKIGALNKEITGVISSISSEGTINNNVTYFTATIDLNKDEMIKPGMSAEVRLINNSVKDTIIIPMEVVQFDHENNPYVLVKDEEGSVVKREIKTGINDGTMVEIKKGIEKDETVYYNNTSTTTPEFGPQMGRP